MCKFTNRLFGLVLLQSVALAMTKPVYPRSSMSDLIDLLYNDYGDYGYQVEETHYDQRQKGEDNIKVRLNSFLIGMPSHDDSSLLDRFANDYLVNIISKHQTTTEPAQTDDSAAKNVIDSAATPVVNIPAPKKEIESRQHANDEVSNPSRASSHILQLLQMLRRQTA